MGTVAIVPVKRFAGAKQRLGDAVGAPARRVLAEAMLRDVLAALGQVEGLDGVIVVTAEPRAEALAAELGASVERDARESGQSPAAEIGLRRASELGHDRALLAPGDCPAIDPVEVDALLAGHTGAGLVVVPDRHGEGTNALLLHPLDAISPSFGPGSCERHVEAAQRAGVPVVVRPVRSLALDVDTPEDLEHLRAIAAPAGAATRAVLDSLLRGEPAG